MTYTQIAVVAAVLAIVIDIRVIKSAVSTRKVFWVSYAIMIFFQLITNGILTGAGIVEYSGIKIIGSDTPVDSRPPFLGDGRIAYAPVEDLIFGFALIVLTLSMWVRLGRNGVQREPLAGPPRFIPSRKRNR
ncbi:MAG: hypothetical protein RIR66_585 [Actinomycetota bacterium]|jgi:hypothetical protein